MKDAHEKREIIETGDFPEHEYDESLLMFSFEQKLTSEKIEEIATLVANHLNQDVLEDIFVALRSWNSAKPDKFVRQILIGK